MKLDHSTGTELRLLYLEVKRGDATQTDTTDVEGQGLTAAIAHCNDFHVDSISIMTCFGSRARLLVYQYGNDYLTPLFPTHDGLATRNEYVRLDSEDGRTLIRKLKYLRDNLVPAPIAMIPSNTSPQPEYGSVSNQWTHSQSYYNYQGITQGGEPQQHVDTWGPVDTWTAHNKIRFNNKRGAIVETDGQDWTWHEDGFLAGNWVYLEKTTGTYFYATTLPN